MWKDILLRLYKSGKINEDRLNNAVEKGIITSEEKEEIIKAP